MKTFRIFNKATGMYCPGLYATRQLAIDALEGEVDSYFIDHKLKFDSKYDDCTDEDIKNGTYVNVALKLDYVIKETTFERDEDIEEALSVKETHKWKPIEDQSLLETDEYDIQLRDGTKYYGVPFDEEYGYFTIDNSDIVDIDEVEFYRLS